MSVSSIPGSGRARSRISIIAAVVAFVALAAFGMRFIPEAAAAEAETEEVGNYIFEVSVDNILGVTDKTTRTRLEDSLEAAPAGTTEEELNALLTEVVTQFNADFGWDLTVAADRAGFRNELNLLSQALFSIPDDTFEIAEYAPLRDLRDLTAGMEGTAECRDRCLPPNPELVDRVISTAVGLSVRKLLSEVSGGGVVAQIAIYAVAVFIGALAGLLLEEGPAITGISSNTLRLATVASAAGIARIAKEFRQDAGAVAQQSAETVAGAVQAAAKEVETATPTEAANESASDYDLVNDEL